MSKLNMVRVLKAGAMASLLALGGLAAHARNLHATPRVSLMVLQPEVAGEPVHALPRVTLDGLASTPPVDGPVWLEARTAYLQRFPDGEPR